MVEAAVIEWLAWAGPVVGFVSRGERKGAARAEPRGSRAELRKEAAGGRAEQAAQRLMESIAKSISGRVLCLRLTARS